MKCCRKCIRKLLEMLNSNLRDNARFCFDEDDSRHVHVFLGRESRHYRNTADTWQTKSTRQWISADDCGFMIAQSKHTWRFNISLRRKRGINKHFIMVSNALCWEKKNNQKWLINIKSRLILMQFMMMQIQLILLLKLGFSIEV